MRTSIHRPHTRPDSFRASSKFPAWHFNSLASYEARRFNPCINIFLVVISIHRPHTRPDQCHFLWLHAPGRFQFTGLIRGPTFCFLGRCNIRRGFNSQASYEARPLSNSSKSISSEFQFTGLIRGPTRAGHCLVGIFSFQFTGLIRGPTIPFSSIPSVNYCFNSQASYEARRYFVIACKVRPMFQFTGLIRGPTSFQCSWTKYIAVSIHRPHTRPDFCSSPSVPVSRKFQFTGLIRGPTPASAFSLLYKAVSIHRPHTRPDDNHAEHVALHREFQFTGLIRGPTLWLWQCLTYPRFQFTGLIRGPTIYNFADNFQHIVSIHRPHTRPDRCCCSSSKQRYCFNSQASYEARPTSP